jgi:hypothetical protein
VPETKKVFSLFGSIWKHLDTDCFRLFVFSVSKRCKIAKTVSIQMLPKASKQRKQYKIAKTVSWSPALCHIKGLVFGGLRFGILDSTFGLCVHDAERGTALRQKFQC